MSTARSHENSANNDTEEPSEHSSSSRSTSVSRSMASSSDSSADESGYLEQDIMQNQEWTTTAMRDARTARIQSRFAIVVALVVSIASMIIQLYR
ncbi:hypothetical protein L1987_85994 [Smallanthus sonchifolius]|uniref:Uncharacterized protein n=1 Tax=Smallanthus sonchifolius TaxID=185202 RepID=A0ACB8XY51_9ASTR|nr:hypothetical protein L1987_85994 [Smallanthus sonchifolius]